MRIQREPRGAVERMDEQGTRAEGLVPVNDDKGMAATAQPHRLNALRGLILLQR